MDITIQDVEGVRMGANLQVEINDEVPHRGGGVSEWVGADTEVVVPGYPWIWLGKDWHYSVAERCTEALGSASQCMSLRGNDILSLYKYSIAGMWSGRSSLPFSLYVIP